MSFIEPSCLLSWTPSKPIAPYPPRKLNILLHDRDAFGVDGAQIGLSGLLQSQDGMGLPPELFIDGTDVMGNLMNEPGERQLAHEQTGALLIAPDLAQSDSSWAVPSCLLLRDRIAGYTKIFVLSVNNLGKPQDQRRVE
ncbi:uncharacterized protein PpBr36_11228 [Pyricularia pennisetigena]|uniref:uncharacterized protein n=1 Tax=Pyricularia pennisetigena TaxID=1578925 RepID=UPI0011512E57|nr:uncharacterized protein PpBr36_11228 [Pyricularia pennisetigena]TLS20546.1 hypothetical protein PpBr36_11228 [Pyricularia pennisetigena]